MVQSIYYLHWKLDGVYVYIACGELCSAHNNMCCCVAVCNFHLNCYYLHIYVWQPIPLCWSRYAFFIGRHVSHASPSYPQRRLICTCLLFSARVRHSFRAHRFYEATFHARATASALHGARPCTAN